jgi:hypothetical protein
MVSLLDVGNFTTSETPSQARKTVSPAEAEDRSSLKVRCSAAYCLQSPVDPEQSLSMPSEQYSAAPG